MKNLGFANGWTEVPEIVREAEEKGYEIERVRMGNCVTRCVCRELNFFYSIDSSD